MRIASFLTPTGLGLWLLLAGDGDGSGVSPGDTETCRNLCPYLFSYMDCSTMETENLYVRGTRRIYSDAGPHKPTCQIRNHMKTQSVYCIHHILVDIHLKLSEFDQK